MTRTLLQFKAAIFDAKAVASSLTNILYELLLIIYFLVPFVYISLFFPMVKVKLLE